MLSNFLKIALRNLRRHRGHYLLNLAGLAAGITCSLLILLYVRHELSYDRHHAKAERIYRFTLGGFAKSGGPWGPTLRDDYPEVEQFARLKRHTEVLVGRGDVRFYERDGFFADSTVFDVFTFPFVAGDPATALTRPRSIVLTASTARRYFGEADPLGQTLTLNNELDVEVTGVIRDVPSASHVHFPFLLSLATDTVSTNEKWDWLNFWTYVVLAEDASPDSLLAQVPGWFRRHLDPETLKGNEDNTYLLQPLRSIHLHSNLEREIEPNGDAAYVYVFSAIGLFILVIACINFVNLSTARAVLRAKEVGVRKTLGAHRRGLVVQFLGESVLLALGAGVLALGLAAALLPVFDDLTGKTLAAADLAQPAFLAGVFGIALVVGVGAGSYPAFVLSSFGAVAAMKGQARGTGNAVLRRGLVVLQFALSIILLVGTGTVYRQVDYVRHRKLGFDKEQIVLIPLRDRALAERYESVKERLLAHPGVVSAAASRGNPGGPDYLLFFEPEGIAPEDVPTIFVVMVDPDFVETYGLEVIAGRDFSREHESDVMGAFLMNEEAARQLGWADPVGKTMAVSRYQIPRSPVIGVLRDFHFRSLHERIAPLVFIVPPPDRFLQLSVKIRPERMDETLAFLERAWAEIDPGRPFSYTFLDEQFGMLHASEERTGRLVLAFALLAVGLACLGLFGLAAFTAERRTREIGIRKVFGASTGGIVLLLTNEFARLVAVAFVVAAPVAYLAVRRWLDGFAYHTDLGWEVFAAAGTLALLVALSTVAYQTLRAALADPVRSLRHD